MGLVTLAWALTVGLTGVVNTLTTPVIDHWKKTELSALTRANAGGRAVAPNASLDAAVATARTALPGMTLQFVAFPGSGYSTSHHYAVCFHGEQPLTRHLVTPALIDAETGVLSAVSRSEEHNV